MENVMQNREIIDGQFTETWAVTPYFYRESKAFQIQCHINFLLSLNFNGKTISVIETSSPVCYTFRT